MVHNNMGSEHYIHRIDAPWGGVRFSTLRDIVITDKATSSTELIEPHDLPRWDENQIRRKAIDTLGYILFSQDLPSPLVNQNPLPYGITYTIAPNGCRKTFNEYVSTWPIDILLTILFKVAILLFRG